MVERNNIRACPILLPMATGHVARVTETLYSNHTLPKSKASKIFCHKYPRRLFPREQSSANHFPERYSTGNNISGSARPVWTSRSQQSLVHYISVCRISTPRLMNLMASKVYLPICMFLTLTSKFWSIENLVDGLQLKVGMSCSLTKSRTIMMLN